jgi:hypothetical protein
MQDVDCFHFARFLPRSDSHLTAFLQGLSYSHSVRMRFVAEQWATAQVVVFCRD